MVMNKAELLYNEKRKIDPKLKARDKLKWKASSKLKRERLYNTPELHVEFTLKRLLNSAKERARVKNREFSISIVDLKYVFKCPILGIPLDYSVGSKKKMVLNSPSLDRIDNTKGYIKGNIAIISLLANQMKSSATAEQLLTFSQNIQKYIGRLL